MNNVFYTTPALFEGDTGFEPERWARISRQGTTPEK
jgi:hypothetical protein